MPVRSIPAAALCCAAAHSPISRTNMTVNMLFIVFVQSYGSCLDSSSDHKKHSSDFSVFYDAKINFMIIKFILASLLWDLTVLCYDF